MDKQDAKHILNELSDYIQSLDWHCENIEDEIPAIRILFDMSDEENQLSVLAPSLKTEDYVIAHIETPDAIMSYSSMFEIVSPVELPLEGVDPSDLLVLVNQVNQTVPLGLFLVKYPFHEKNPAEVIAGSMVCQKYTFSFSDDELFSMETICEILLLLLEQKRIMESMIAAIQLGKPAAEVISAFVDYGK